MRCQTCGRRLEHTEFRCPEHGVAAAAEGVSKVIPPMPTLGGLRVESVLGIGGFATVFGARRLDDNSQVAIKLAHQDVFAERGLQNEAQAMGRIGPPAVPQVYQIGILPSGEHYLTLEFVSGKTLAERLSAPWAVDVFLVKAQELLGAIELIHSRGVIHCDLKPENIFVDEGVRVLDFGLARFVADPTQATEAASSELAGTAEYMAPEQCHDKPIVGTPVDVYALGIIFYEMLTGRVPFWGAAAQVRQAHLSHRPQRPSSLVAMPQRLEEWLLQCLAKDPSQRPTASQLKAGFAELVQVAAVPELTPRPAPAPLASKGKERQKRTMGLLFFESTQDASHLAAELSAFGGVLGSALGQRIVAIFDVEAGENLAKRALVAAEELVARGIAAQIRVDLASVTVRVRPDGGRAYMSSLFSRSDSFPVLRDSATVTVTAGAAMSLSSEPRLEALREGLFQLKPAGSAVEQLTLARRGAEPSIGREELMASLLLSAQRCVETKTPTLVTIIGEAGLGKSHLSADLLNRLGAEFPQAKVLYIQAHEPAGSNRDQAIRELLRQSLQLPTQTPVDGVRQLLASTLGDEVSREVWVGVAVILGWLPLEASEVKAMAAAPGALRRAAARAASVALRKLAGTGPLLILADDLQFADEAMLDALEDATQSEGACAIWVCGLARPSFETARPAWGERAGEKSTHRLEPLGELSARKLCQNLLLPAEDIPLGAIDKLVERTRGSPLLLVELVRTLKSQGLVRRQGRAQNWYLATDELEQQTDLPLVDWLAIRELASLPAELASHARLLSLLGPEFAVSDIAGIIDTLDLEGNAAVFPLDAAAGTRQLVDLELIVSHRNGRFTFRHALMREAIARAVPEELRMQVHAAALQFYRQAQSFSYLERTARVALHAAAAGHKGEAMEAYFLLADMARAKHAYLEAEAMFSHALESMPQEAAVRRMQSFQGRGLMRYRLSRYEDALKDFAAARDQAVTLHDVQTQLDTMLDEATALDWMEEYRRSSDVVEAAYALAQGVTSPHIEARLYMGRGRSCVRFSKDSEAADWLNRAADKAQELGDAGYETWVISLLLNGYVLTTLGRLTEAQAAFERVIPVCIERGDKLHLGAAVGNRFMLWSGLNDKKRLLADLEQLLEISRELGNLRMQKTAHFYLSLYLHWLGDSGPAQEHARKVVDLDKRTLGQGARPESMVLLARTLAAAGAVEEARAVLRDIESHLAQGRERGDAEVVLVPAEEALYSMVDLLTRNGTDTEWRSLRERATASLTGQDLIEFYESQGQAALRRGENLGAVQAFGDALEVANRIPNVMLQRIRTQLHNAQEGSVRQ